MRILLDEGLPRRAAVLLRETGIDAVHLTEIDDSSTADELILEKARDEERVVVTLDADFHALLALAGSSAPSVIRIRRQGLSARDVCDLVTRLIADQADALTAGSALSVRAHLVGIRKLPLTSPAVEQTDPGDDDK
jgi:predicted nuclease of predicted toxin-antitoxin system